MRREGDDRGIGDSGRSPEDDAHYRQLQRHRRARLAKFLVALLLVLLLILFIVQNYKPQPVIHYVFFTKRAHLLWVMLTCALLGGIIGFLVGRPGKTLRFHDDDRR